ncbi:MAG: hypothetical protein CVV47_11765 [Spirochaetae bacterium HGW-Spirochaetae-3]|nr:MAG: hypothetical protein CVV47_11765 [Spirochaetae bacterium HGW-Spirochaetae-3]
MIVAPVAVLLIAATPLLFEKRAGAPAFVLGPALEAIAGWLRGLADGSSFEYSLGSTVWNFFDVAPRFFAVSLLYVVSAGSVGMAAGVALGLSLRGRAADVASSILGSLYAIPDFISAILLQLVTIVILDATGFKIGRISHDAASGVFLLLPFVLLTVYPFAFAFKTTLRKSVDAEREPFAVFALSKGLSKRTVRLKHIGAAVIPSISTELPTLLGIMQANLFMAEYIFALPGITRFLFLVGFSGRRAGWIESYQYPVAVAVLLGVMILYLAAWEFFRLALYAVRRALTGER